MDFNRVGVILWLLASHAELKNGIGGDPPCIILPCLPLAGLPLGLFSVGNCSNFTPATVECGQIPCSYI